MPLAQSIVMNDVNVNPRNLPSVERVLRAAGALAVPRFGQKLATDIVRHVRGAP